MMQAAKSRHGYDFATYLRIRRGHSALGVLLLQCETCPDVMAVADVFAHQPFQMPLIEHDDMVKQVVFTITNPVFGYAVLPGTSEAGPIGLDAEACYGADNFCARMWQRPTRLADRCRIVGKWEVTPACGAFSG
jgi:hypothetical protein